MIENLGIKRWKAGLMRRKRILDIEQKRRVSQFLATKLLELLLVLRCSHADQASQLDHATARHLTL